MTQPADRMPHPSVGPFDLEALDRATFGDRALAREVLQLFERQADTLVHAIAETADARVRREAAHALKGAARGVAAHAVADAAAAIENAPEDSPALAGALARLAATVMEARRAAAALIARG